jgi:hypothetical protein
LLVTLGLVALNWGGIDRPNLEAGDFAANSLQVLQAKSGLILEGHYSRFGFHHPGPALLYLLALNEVVLFDTFGLVPSAFSAHLIAVAFLNAASITSVAFMLRTLARSWLMAFAGTAIFVVSLSWMNIQVFNSAWFPYMYALPFAAFLTSLAVVIRGYAKGLVFAAFFGGLLINGHASFLFIVPAVVALVLVVTVITRRLGARLTVPLGTWLRTNSRPAVASAIVFGIFLMPLLIRLLTQWPSPLREYASDGASGAGRDLSVGISAFLVNPRGTWVVIVAAIIAITIMVMSFRLPALAASSALALVLLSATAVHLFYNIVGVDDAANSYLSFYFLVVPALVPTAIILMLDQRSSDLRVAIPVALLAVVAVGYAAVINKTNAWPQDYQREDVLVLDELITEDSRPIVLDLDSSQDWGSVWSAAIGYVLLQERLGEHRVCVRENWFVGFTEELRCTPEDEASGQALRINRSDNGIVVTAGVGAA